MIIKTKEGTDPLNANKTKKLTKDELVEAYLDRVGAIKKSHGGGEPTPPVPPKIEGEATKYNLPGIEVARKAAKQEIHKQESAFDLGA